MNPDNNVPVQPIPAQPSPQPQSHPHKAVKFLILIAGLLVVLGIAFVAKTLLTRTDTGQIVQTQEKIWHYYPANYDVRKVVVDGDVVWTAYYSGLVKYDQSGKILKTYTAKDGLIVYPTDLIKIGNKLFIGSNSGLAILDLATEKFSYLAEETQHNYNANINNFEFDGSKLWMSTFGGIRSLDVTTLEWKNYDHRDARFVLQGGRLLILDVRAVNTDSSIMWSMDKETGKSVKEIQLPGQGWDSIAANDKYVVASVESNNYQLGTELYYKELPAGQWKKLSIPLLDTKVETLGSLTLDNDTLYFELADRKNNNAQTFVSYDIAKKITTEYPIQDARFAGAVSVSSIYADAAHGRVWGGTQKLVYLDLNTKTYHEVVESTPPVNPYSVLAAKGKEVLVSGESGVGILNYETGSYESVVKGETLTDAQWVNDTIWLDLSYIGEVGGDLNRIGKYDRKTKTFEKKDRKSYFTLVKNQPSLPEGEVLIQEITYANNQSKIQIGTYNFNQDVFTSLAVLEPTTPAVYKPASPFYSETYGVLVSGTKNIKALNIKTKEFKTLVETTFNPLFVREYKNGVLLMLSDKGGLYKWTPGSNAAVQVLVLPDPTSIGPREFAIYKDMIAIQKVESVATFNVSDWVNYGDAGFSFLRPTVLLVDENGTEIKKLGPTDGMMRTSATEIVGGGECLWFSAGGIWAYCGK